MNHRVANSDFEGPWAMPDARNFCAQTLTRGFRFVAQPDLPTTSLPIQNMFAAPRSCHTLHRRRGLSSLARPRTEAISAYWQGTNCIAGRR
jgi:hypothetical protein